MSIPIFHPRFVGHFFDGADWNFLPMTHREVDRATMVCYRLLETCDAPRHGGALVIACFDDWAMTIPLEAALSRHKQIIYNADDSPFEANRIEMFIRRFDPKLVFGVTGGVLQGLASMGHAAEQLFAGRHVWCRDAQAYQQLSPCADITLRQWRQIGPAAAMECAQGGGLHVDSDEWLLEAIDGCIVVSNRRGRFPEIVRQSTGLRGEVVTDCCGCGIFHPRVQLAAGS